MTIRIQPDGVYLQTVEGIPIYRIRALDAFADIAYAIFTRNGGVSQPPFRSLNLSTAVGDAQLTVEENIKYACRVLQTTPKQTRSCHLVHGADILTVNGTRRKQGIMAKADGMITRDPDRYLFMRFGDCAPLILYDPVQNAIGLTHAGWRGTIKNAAGATVEAMRNEWGCQPKDIMAVIGPAIGPCCYEVGPDVITAATAAFDDSASLFSHQNGSQHHAHFNLWEANRRQLAATGVEQIIETSLCTACRTDEFFSHRAENGRTGRFGVMIGLKRNGE